MTATKWQVEAWPAGSRFVKVNGNTTYTRTFARDYASQASALRAASQVHRGRPGERIELARYELQACFWMERERVTVRLCPTCRGRLDWQDSGMYHCPQCGDEWHDDHFAGDP
jgi:hypothetical protein